MMIRISKPYCLALSSIALAMLAIVLCSPSAQAAQVILNPAKDNTIYQGFQENSCGAGPNFFIGATKDAVFLRGLIQFDIAGAIPAGATIDRVTLTLDSNRTPDNQDAPATLHPVLTEWGEGVANCDLIDGGGQGAPANRGDATWLFAQFQQVSWTVGGDFGAASANALIPPRGTALWDGAANPDMALDVQNWLDDPRTNFGWIVVGDETRPETARRFSSRTGRTPPVLTVDFTTAADTFSCCFPDGGCSLLSTPDCTAQGGISDTNSTTCSPNPCPQPLGACCNLDESCSDAVERATCEANGGLFQGGASTCADPAVNCGLEPFVDALPIPGVLQPVATRTDGVLQYEVTMDQVAQQLHRDLLPTTVWGYNGFYPGLTIEATSGQPIEVKWINNLPLGGHYLVVDECPHGPNYWKDSVRTVAHLHGGHVPARFDGQPEYTIMPGEFDTYEYPNNQPPATLWYHDHGLGITRLNVYMGLAAYYLIRDDFENSLGLPSGEFEIPAVIQDRQFNEDGSLSYPATMADDFFGDKILVNGKVWPFLNVKQGKYRFRFVNGSQARTYTLRLENLADPTQVIPFTLIGTGGGLISAPIPLNGMTMAPAERFDVVIDFAGLPAGTEIVLRNDQPGVPDLPNVMKFIVTDQPGHTAALPSTLRTVVPIPEAEASVTRRFRLLRTVEACAGSEWLVQSLDAQGNVIGEHWDDITDYPVLGTTEIWEFENPGNSMMHPMHIHLVLFQVLDRRSLADGSALPLDPWEINTWKDTVKALPGTLTRVIARFESYLGRFSYHCHILDHEDHEMMRQFQTTNDPANCNNNGVCEPLEDCINCSTDCGRVSGAFCGNRLCEAGDGEDCLSCPQDCAGSQTGGTGNQFCCGDGAGTNPILNCGNASDGFTVVDDRCSTGGFYCRVKARVLACCGDALCEGQETEASCANDCAPPCTPTGPEGPFGDASCTDGIDNDCDGLIDGEDADCVCTPTGSEGPFGDASCADGLDNDCDGLIDANDPECQCSPVPEGPFGDATCADGEDNDCDGLIDSSDPDCAATFEAGDIAPQGAPDGIVNFADALVAMQIAFGLVTPTQLELERGDVAPLGSPDGRIDITDAFLILRKAAGLASF